MFAKSYSKLYNYSFKKTVANTYINSTYLLEIAFNQKEEVKKILLDNGFVEMTIKDLTKIIDV